MESPGLRESRSLYVDNSIVMKKSQEEKAAQEKEKENRYSLPRSLNQGKKEGTLQKLVFPPRRK